MSKPFATTTNRSSLVALAAFTLAGALAFTGVFVPADRGFYDQLYRWKLAVAPFDLSPRVVPIDLTDSAERNLGASLDSRQAFADLLRVLGDGKLVGGMDFVFSGVHDAMSEKALVEAARAMDALVLAVVPFDRAVTRFSGRELDEKESAVLEAHLWHPRVIHAGSIPTADYFMLPELNLAAASRYLGHIATTPDEDGLYRKTPLFYRWHDGYLPSLSLAMAAAFLRIDPQDVVIDAGRSVTLPLSGGPLVIPVDDSGRAWIPFPGRWNQGWKRTGLDKVAKLAALPEAEDDALQLWEGSVVLAADLTTSHKDFGTTALETVYPLSGIHSSLLNAILTRQVIRQADPLLACLLMIATGMALVWLVRLRGRALHTGVAALFMGLLALSAALWFGFLMVPWVAAPLAALALVWVIETSRRVLQSSRERALMESALSRYVPRAVAGRVLRENKVDLLPVQKELTLLFADISGFTKWSSDKPADLVHGFLSEYLETMATILFEHGGTVDKFMGDGVLAFFGDPFEQADHASRCVRAAVAMQNQASQLGARWKVEAGLDLKIRIGINSGTVVVGNLGSKTRIEYTVIGSAVNLAQRMESQAPLGGILVTAATWQRTQTLFQFSPPQSVTVKGYDEDITAYVVLS